MGNLRICYTIYWYDIYGGSYCYNYWGELKFRYVRNNLIDCHLLIWLEHITEAANEGVELGFGLLGI